MSSSITVGTIVANCIALRRSVGMRASWVGVWANEALAQSAPSAISTARSSIRSRSVASRIGGITSLPRWAARIVAT